MSKTWKEQPRTQRTDLTPQRAIERLRIEEAEQDIREATQEVQYVATSNR